MCFGLLRAHHFRAPLGGRARGSRSRSHLLLRRLLCGLVGPGSASFAPVGLGRSRRLGNEVPAVALVDTRAYRHSSRSSGSFSPPRDHQRARAVQTEILPVTGRCREPAFLAQLLAQEPRESSRPHHPGMVEPVVNRELLATQGDNSRIRWSSSQE